MKSNTWELDPAKFLSKAEAERLLKIELQYLLYLHIHQQQQQAESDFLKNHQAKDLGLLFQDNVLLKKYIL